MNIIDKLVPTLLREENPDFSKLLSLIEDKISPTGASLNILQQNKESKEELDIEKTNYMKSKIIYDEVNTAIIESKSSKSSQSNTKFYEDIEDGVCLAELNHSLRIGSTKLTRYGLTENDLNNHAASIQMSSNTNQRLLADIENRIHAKALEILTYDEPYNEQLTGDASTLYKMNAALALELTSLQQTQQESDRLDFNITTEYKKFLELNLSFEKCMETLVLNLNYGEKIRTDMEEFALLEFKLNTLEKKVRNTELEILCENYTSNNVNALRTISERLKCEDRALQRDKSHNEQKLDQYSRLVDSDKFLKLVERYGVIKERIAAVRQCIGEYDRVGNERASKRAEGGAGGGGDTSEDSEESNATTAATSKESSQW